MDQTVSIPRNSFTAFRLTYLSPPQIAHSSRTVFLGVVPHVWGADDASGLFASLVSRSKGRVRRHVRSTVHSLSGIRFRSKKSLGWLMGDERRARQVWALLQGSESSESDDDEDEEACVSHASGTGLGLRWTESRQHTGSSESSFRSETLVASPTPFEPQLEPPPAPFEPQFAPLEPSDSSVYEDAHSTLSEPPSLSQTGVKFSEPRRKSKISIAHPEPLSEAPELLRMERDHHRLNQRLRSLAHFSKGQARKTKNDFKSRFHRTIMKSFSPGEVIQETNVLMMVKEAYKVSRSIVLSENECCDTRVLEYWRELWVVLRKAGDDDDVEVVLQVFRDPHKAEKPVYEFGLGLGVNASLYSDTDKTICVSRPGAQEAMKFFLLKFRTQVESVRWLYFMRQVLSDGTNSAFHVAIPHLGVTVEVGISEKVLMSVFEDHSQQEVTVMPNGYRVSSSPLLHHLLKEIKKSVVDLGHEDWFNSLLRPWFCFRQYDRLEWIADDSEIFYMKNTILSPSFQLEFREMASEKLLLCGMPEPPPIEGFLSRLSTMSGSEQNLVRTFYKISYFYTCDDVLFFTRYYRGLPPSPGNVLLMDDEPKRDLHSLLPEIYEHRGYDMDSHNHFAWLDDKEAFDDADKAAFMEYERRAELTTKADCAIDLCSVAEIVPVAADKVKLQHKLYLGLLWYQRTDLIKDEEILDSCFDIITTNGGFIKLQAPNRRMRDEWIRRLLELRDYWFAQRQEELKATMATRESNQETLKINEYRDSNITHQVSGNEMRRSTANSFHGVNHITLETPLLRSGYLYQKSKKHADFNQFFVTLTNGSLTLYSLFKRSKITGEWKRGVYFKHYLSLSLDNCYVYSGLQTELDLLDRNTEAAPGSVFINALPRIYIDGWKSQEEESMLCFTVWFGKKRSMKTTNEDNPKNPNMLKMASKLGVTGQSMVFMARSRQERELWVSSISAEIDRFTILYKSAS